MSTGAQLPLLHNNEGHDLSSSSQAGLEKSPTTKVPFFNPVTFDRLEKGDILRKEERDEEKV